MEGPGKYDESCTAARLATGSGNIILIVIRGTHGESFSAQVHPIFIPFIPTILRDIADNIEREQHKTPADGIQ